MKNISRNLWLAAVLICCLCPVGFAHHNCDKNHSHDCQTAATEGGSASIYLLGIGLICSGAMLLRSRAVRTS